jgi:hypothetical protein
MVAVQVKVKTIERLFATPSSLTHAVQNLEHALAACRWIEIYKHFFPKEWKEETPVALGDREGLSILFLRMCALVDARLFPVPWWYTDQIETEFEYEPSSGYCGGQIPIQLMNDWWYDRGVEGLDTLERAILRGSGEIDEAGEIVHKACWIDRKKLKAKMRYVKKPLKYLPVAMGIVFHCTGNPYADIDGDQEPFSSDWWSVEAVKGWRDCFIEYKELLRKYRELEKWLGNNKKRFEQVRELVASVMVERKEDGWQVEVF